MKRKAILLIAAAMMLMVGTVSAQNIRIPGTNASLTLKKGNWRYLRTYKLDDGSSKYVYYYIRETLIDSDGDTVLPFLSVYVNENYSGDLYSLVYDRYMLQPYQALKEYTHGIGLPAKGGLGYEGAYTNPSEHKDYQFMMTYFTAGKAMVELRLETTKDTFAKLEGEFENILKSVK